MGLKINSFHNVHEAENKISIKNLETTKNISESNLKKIGVW
jgi:hypothetical protein